MPPAHTIQLFIPGQFAAGTVPDQALELDQSGSVED